MTEEQEKKSSWSLGSIIFIIIIIAMALILLQKNGVTMTKVEEKSEMTDDPHEGF